MALRLESLEDRILPGLFFVPPTFAAGNDPVAVGDFNGDGKLDLVTANQPMAP